MDLGISGRVAVVGGGSQGMGKAIALELAREGARVAVCARNEPGLDTAVADIRTAVAGAEVAAIKADVGRAEDVEALAATVRERLGTASILVNAAGHGSGGTLDTVTPDALRENLDLNLLPCLLLSRAFAQGMAEQGWGRIVFVAAVSGRQPTPGQLASNVSKAGVINLAKELSTELAESGITVNAVLPGRIASERVLRVFPEDERRRRARVIPMRRYGTPEEFASAVVFLASERAAYITGVALAVDGGLVSSMF